MNRLIQGDAAAVLATLPASSVHCCVTSPPYFGLRDYGVDGQGGLQKTPAQYINWLLEVGDQIHRVLRDDGTFWLNIGDSYQQKSQLGIPWQVATAMVRHGWLLRQDIIWAKPNPMPHPVTDRCVSSHEHIFLFSKKPRYYFDTFALREKSISKVAGGYSKKATRRIHIQSQKDLYDTRLPRDVWSFSTGNCKDKHFAAFPEELPRRCIAAGTSRRVCAKCGKPWSRWTQKDRKPTRPGTNNTKSRDPLRHVTSVVSLGFYPTCDCRTWATSAVVLDPFVGSGTTPLVASKLGRYSISVDLNREYLDLTHKRLLTWPPVRST